MNSDNSRSESIHKSSDHNSLVLKASRGVSSGNKHLRKEIEPSDQQKYSEKTSTVSSSVNRMIRSSPKINLKQNITNSIQASFLPKKESSHAKNYKNKLHLNRHTIEKGVMPHESTRNEKLEGLLNKHILNPAKTSSYYHNKSKCSPDNYRHK
jgi:hypothetical protein